MNDGLGARHHVARGKHAIDRGHTTLVGEEQSSLPALEAGRREDELVLWALADADDRGVRVVLDEVVVEANDVVILVKDGALEDGTVLREHRDCPAVGDLGTFELGICEFVRAGGDLLRARVHGHVAGTAAKCRARDVDRGVSHADDCDRLAQLEGRRVREVVDREVHVGERLATHAEGSRAPNASAHEDTLVTVTEEVANLEGAADRRVCAEHDAHVRHALRVAIEDGAREAKLRDAVAHDPADALLRVENRDAVALMSELHGNRDARWSGSDDGNRATVGRLALDLHALEVEV